MCFVAHVSSGGAVAPMYFNAWSIGCFIDEVFFFRLGFRFWFLLYHLMNDESAERIGFWLGFFFFFFFLRIHLGWADWAFS